MEQTWRSSARTPCASIPIPTTSSISMRQHGVNLQALLNGPKPSTAIAYARLLLLCPLVSLAERRTARYESGFALDHQSLTGILRGFYAGTLNHPLNHPGG